MMLATARVKAAFLCVAAMPAGGVLGCTGASVQWHDRWGAASLAQQYQARDGGAGRALDFADMVARCGSADVVLFGEEHNNPICNAVEAALYGELIRRGRSPTLAMEFFERDAQPALNDYLAQKSTEADFRKAARQGKAYPHSHRPLIEMARTAKLPVVAANAPRTLVREFRKSGLAFDAFRVSRSVEEQALMAANLHVADAGYRARFVEIMGGHSTAPASEPTAAPAANHAFDDVVEMAPLSQPSAPTQPDSPPSPELLNSVFNAQLLWDSTMAESVAQQRERSPSRPVLLIVGRFHVEQVGGTLQALQALRPRDRITTIVFRSHESLPASEPTQGVADIVIDGFEAPPAKEQ